MIKNSNLDKLYSLRRNFTIIAITGRTGSGCSKVSSILSSKIDNLIFDWNVSRNYDNTRSQKRQLVVNFCKKNWNEYKVIEYKKVLFYLLLPDLFDNPNNTLLMDYFRYRMIALWRTLLPGKNWV